MAQLHLRKYGASATINFVLYGITGVDLKSDAAHAAGDTKIMKDEGAEADTTNGFTDEGQGYAIVLTATEMQAARLVLYIVDSATKVWLDTAVIIETYGHASAQHPFDLSAVTQPVNVTQWNGTNVTTPDTAGSPKVTITAGTGAGQLDTTSGAINITQTGADKVWASATRTLSSFGTLVADVATAVWDKATSALTTAGSIGKLIVDNLNATVSSRLASASYTAPDNATITAIQADTNDIQNRLPAALVGGLMDSNVGAISTDTAAADNAEAFFDGTGYAGTGNVIPSVTTVTGNVNGSVGSVTGAVGSVSGAVGSVTGNVGGNVAGSVASVTAGVIVTTNNDKTGYSLSAAGIQAIWDALTAALTTAGSIGKLLVDNVNGSMSTVLARLPAALTGAGNMKVDALAINGSTSAAAQLARSAATIVNGAAIAGTLSTTEMTTDLTEATNDHYNGRIIIWTSGVLLNQATAITDYDGATKKLTYTAITEAPGAGDTFIIV